MPGSLHPAAVQASAALLAAAFVALASGCGDPAAPKLSRVRGVVRLDGEPLRQARIEFQPDGPKGSPSMAESGPDGRFDLQFNRNLKGASPGTHRVRITTATSRQAEPEKATRPAEILPTRYHRNTELRYEVRPRANWLEIELHSDSTSQPAEGPGRLRVR